MAGPCAETLSLLFDGVARLAGPALRRAEGRTTRTGERPVSTGNTGTWLLRVRAVTCVALLTSCRGRMIHAIRNHQAFYRNDPPPTQIYTPSLRDALPNMAWPA